MDNFLEKGNGALRGIKPGQEQKFSFAAFHDVRGQVHLARNNLVEIESPRIGLDQMLIGIESLLGMSAAVEAAGVELLSLGRFISIGPEEAQGIGLTGSRAGLVGAIQRLDIIPLGRRIFFMWAGK